MVPGWMRSALTYTIVNVELNFTLNQNMVIDTRLFLSLFLMSIKFSSIELF